MVTGRAMLARRHEGSFDGLGFGNEFARRRDLPLTAGAAQIISYARNGSLSPERPDKRGSLERTMHLVSRGVRWPLQGSL